MSTDAVRAGQERMRGLVAQLPAQLAESAGLEGLDAVTAPARPPRRVVLCGMGGSAIAGDLVRPLLPGVPLVVHRDYGLPAWTADDDLVVLSSYSGGTEETLDAWSEATRRGVARLAITAGGRLATKAGSAGVPVVRLPGGLPPRSALGYGLGALVRVMDRLALLPGGADMLDAAAAELEPRVAGLLGADTGGDDHPAHVAGLLEQRTAVIHTAGDAAHAAGRRLQAQLNENAKVPARIAAYPELDHNEIVGWNDPAATAARFALVVLRGGHEPAPLARRVEATCALLADSFGSATTVTAEGATPLARALSLVLWGDALSWHLAVCRGIDPVPVDRIENLKRALAGPADA